MHIPIRQTLEERLEDTEEALQLGEKLRHIIEDQQGITFLEANLNLLRAYKADGECLLEKKRTAEKAQEAFEKSIDTLAYLVQKDYPSYEAARKDLKKKAYSEYRQKKQRPYRAFISECTDGIGLMILGILTPFSKPKRTQLFQLSQKYFALAKSTYQLIQEKNNDSKRLEPARTTEALEKDLVEKLVKEGMSRDVADTLVANPPYISIVIIEGLKEQYAPWL